jgi:hypothetical protein
MDPIYALGIAFAVLLSLTAIIIIPIIIYNNFSIIFTPSVRNYDICNLVPSKSVGHGDLFAPSFWTSQLFFFAGYLLYNAYSLYTLKPNILADEVKVQNRKDQALTAMIVTILFTLIVVFLRFKTGCETVFGVLVAAIVMVPAGVGWYYVASLCGARNADIFGISSRILVPSATTPAAQVCVNKSV